MERIIEDILAEAQTFSTLSGIEQSLSKGTDLSPIPLPALYIALRRLHPQDCSKYLERLTVDQRQALLDIDLWKKDDLDLEHFQFWPLVYCEASDPIRFKFVQSSSFALFLKARFNIHTFDVEDPQYPDHDHYFLTEDSLLLFEYDENNRYINEFISLIRDLYTVLGVENAYAHLFKIVSDSYYPMLEDEYHLKKGRLLDSGLMDYYLALKHLRPFPNREIMDATVHHKKTSPEKIQVPSSATPPLDQALHIFRESDDPLHEELSLVRDQERAHVLQLDFTRLINASLVHDNALKNGDEALYEVGHRVRAYLLLGLDYVLHKKGRLQNGSLFDCFDFRDFYRYGYTLVEIKKRILRQTIEGHSLSQDDPFFGAHWGQFIEDSFSLPPRYKGRGPRAKEIVSFVQYDAWSKEIATLVKLLPFLVAFAQRLMDLKKSNALRDEFYLNYNVDDIDYEAIILSSLANFFFGHHKNPSMKKMGLTLDEFKRFVHTFSPGANRDVDKRGIISDFAKAFGLAQVPHFNEHMVCLLQEHLGGHEYDKMKDSDYYHLGGAIILRTA